MTKLRPIAVGLVIVLTTILRNKNVQKLFVRLRATLGPTLFKAFQMTFVPVVIPMIPYGYMTMFTIALTSFLRDMKHRLSPVAQEVYLL